ncbi:unnamed protein product, partial [Bubo scandiacus]
MSANTALLTLEELCQLTLAEDIIIYYLDKEIHLQEPSEEAPEATWATRFCPGGCQQPGAENQDGKEMGNQLFACSLPAGIN